MADNSKSGFGISDLFVIIIMLVTLAFTFYGQISKPNYATTDRVNGIDKRVENCEKRFERMETKIDNLPERIVKAMGRK